MIYVLDNQDPQLRALWTAYAEHCIQWRVRMLEHTDARRPPAAQQSERVHALEEEIHKGSMLKKSVEEHWSDALLLWQRQPADARAVVVEAVGAKLSTVPEALGICDIPRRFVFLPTAVRVLANAVADVARDTAVIWQFRAHYLGPDVPDTLKISLLRVAAYSLAALLNRREHLTRDRREERTWFPWRIVEEPDIPDLELVPSW
jgi:hypothetical protein